MKASASVHAGTNFSYILYHTCLEFYEDGNVLLTRETDSSADTYDQDDLRFFQNYRLKGYYHIDSGNFIQCTFETQFWKFAGTFTGPDKRMLVFHNQDSRLNQTWSEVFKLVE